VNVFGDTEIRDHRYWAPDRLHLNSDGHRRVAALVLHALGHGPLPEPGTPGIIRRRSLATEARFYGEHVAPWVQRRLRGRSSGDARDPKHPLWHPVRPA
jgi:hypothetical protein